MSTIKDMTFPPQPWLGGENWWPTNWTLDSSGRWNHANVADARSYVLGTVDDWPDKQGLIWRITFPTLRLGRPMDSTATRYHVWVDRMVDGGAFTGVALTVYSGVTTDGRPYAQFIYADASNQTRSATDAIFDDQWSVGNEGWVRLWRDGATMRLDYSALGQTWTNSAPFESFNWGSDSDSWRVRFQASYASQWREFHGFSLAKPSQLWMADPTGNFRNVGTAEVPLYLRKADGTWHSFDGTGDASLRVRMPDGTWKTVIG